MEILTGDAGRGIWSYGVADHVDSPQHSGKVNSKAGSGIGESF